MVKGGAVFRCSDEFRPDTQWLDESTVNALEWKDLWAQFQPVTQLGIQQKNQLQPFLPGNENKWQAAYNLLESDAAFFDVRRLEKVRTVLEGVPDLTSTFQRLKLMARNDTGNSLSAREALLLKQFVFQGKRLAGLTAKTEGDLWSEKDWFDLLRIFGHPEQSSFSVGHIAGKRYHEAVFAYSRAVEMGLKATMQRNEEWHRRFGIRPNREGQVVCSLPEQEAAARRLKVTPGVQWLRDTPFESTFSLSESSQMKEFQDELESWRQVMDTEAENALKKLTGKLVAEFSLWMEAAGQVAKIDLRLAKVVLWRKWQGCRPALASTPRIEGAVHPLLARQFLEKGQRYVPLEWMTKTGVNVLCGANMGGKTLSMRLLATCQALAQYGLPVPAKGFATRLYAALRFYSSVSAFAQAGLAQTGLSAFGREIWEMRSSFICMEAAGGPVFHCFDEPAKSTNPVEGEALVVGLLRVLLKRAIKGSVIVVATHYPAAIREPGVGIYRVKGFCGFGGISKDEEAPVKSSADKGRARNSEILRSGILHSEILQQRLGELSRAMDYHLEPVTSSEIPQDGLEVASWLDLPKEILQESRQYLAGQKTGPAESRLSKGQT